MANSAQAKKRAKQAEKSRAHNASMRSEMRTATKKVVNAIEAGNKAEAEAAYKVAKPILDVMARKGIINMNKAARHKSRMNKHINAM
ncbi:MAG TPA: 30S ribosomal protein S20 [Chromatiales bacterium]|nr:30S ribosomal protein S20 [Chromatiales bacterium]